MGSDVESWRPDKKAWQSTVPIPRSLSGKSWPGGGFLAFGGGERLGGPQ